MKRRTILVASLAVATMLSVPALLSADTNSTRDTEKVSQVADHLYTFEQQAAEVSRDAETLLSLTRSGQVTWQSHAYYLSTLRNGINGMGRMLALSLIHI